MTDPTEMIAPYRSIIKKEAEHWLVRGRPVPLFLYYVADEGLPPEMKSHADRNLISDESGNTLFAVDFLTARIPLDEGSEDLTESLRDGPAKRYAPVLFHDGKVTQFLRIDLPGLSSLESIDALKIRELCGILEGHAMAAAIKGPHREFVLKSYTRGLDRLLTLLLQRPPTQTELDQVLATLNH